MEDSELEALLRKTLGQSDRKDDQKSPNTSPPPESGPWQGLRQVARSLRKTLVAVTPRPDFEVELRQRLKAAFDVRLRAVEAGRRLRRRLLVVGAGLGGLVYLAGLVVVSLRTAATLLWLVTSLLGWRAARSSTSPGERT